MQSKGSGVIRCLLFFLFRQQGIRAPCVCVFKLGKMPSFKEYFGCTVFIMMGDGFHPPAQMGRDASCP
jgi:hypothetical protein